MTPPYAIHFKNLTSDMGSIHNQQQKIDARHYNGYLLIPGIVYNLASKLRNSILNKHFTFRLGGQFTFGIIYIHTEAYTTFYVGI